MARFTIASITIMAISMPINTVRGIFKRSMCSGSMEIIEKANESLRWKGVLV